MFIKVLHDETMKEIDTTLNLKNIIKKLKKYCSNDTDIELITSIDDLYFYSHKSGENINIHKIPGYTDIFYDELFIIKHDNHTTIDIDVSEYSIIYSESIDYYVCEELSNESDIINSDNGLDIDTSNY